MKNDTTSVFDPETLRTFEKVFEDYGEDALWHMANLAKSRYPDRSVERMENWLQKQQRLDNDLLTRFRRGAKPASMMNADPPRPEQVWFGIYRGAVSYLAGETGAGKSSALYNIAVHAAQDKPLWGVPFSLGRPLNVLYLDPENARLQAAWKINNIGQGRPQKLAVHPADGVDLSDSRWQIVFRQLIMEDAYDLVLLDPLINLFMTVNENDNPEGARQIKFLQSVAQETKAAILVVHHMGKNIENGSAGSSDYGRGASSRLASADVGMRWRSRGEGDESDDTYLPDEKGIERSDECRLRITKNRLGRQGSLFLKMAGSDKFEVSSHAAWCGKAEKGDKKSQLELALESVTDLLEDGEWKARVDILASLKQEGIGLTNGDKALKQMCDDGILDKRGYGKNAYEYAKVDAATPRQAA